MKRWLLVIMVFWNGLAHAQQWPIHSHYLFNDLLYNPATTGHYKYHASLLSLRRQWMGLDGSPATYMASHEYGFAGKPVGVGGYMLSDQTGPLSRTGITGSGSYEIDLATRGQLYLGLAVGLYRLGLSGTSLIQQGNDPTLIAAQAGTWLPDANAGIHYVYRHFWLGLSSPQVLQSRADLSGTGVSAAFQTRRAWHITGGSTWKAAADWSITPSFLVRYSKPSLWQLEISSIATYRDQIWAGASYRTQDAVTLLMGVTIQQAYTIGYAYDATISPLRNHSSGSHEIVLGYRWHKEGDRDGDGIKDEEDDCPDEPGPRSNNGCPLEKPVQTDKKDLTDTDGDGIPDAEDDCPRTVGVAENKGCPIINPEQQLTLDVAINNLEFEWDKDIIMDTSRSALDNLADLLLEKGDWKLYVAGHTDNSGTEEYNFRLSRRRAYAVRDYLSAKGVDKDRMVVEFFGEYMPIADNDTPEGRQKNRRVEMKFLFE